MTFQKLGSFIGVGAVLLTVAGGAQAQVWTDWTSANATTADGTLGGISVNFTGNIFTAGNVLSPGGNYWTPSASYTSVGVTAPSPVDVIALGAASTGNVQTITFSSPVVNPLLAIVSLGNVTPTTWTFGQTPTLISQGAGFFGGGPTSLSLIGNALTGSEGNGVLRFTGTFTTLSWTVAGGEDFTGFQVGAPNPSAPEPTTLALLALGGVGGAMVARRRKMSA